MSDNKWQDKSVSERLTWFNNELHGLFDYLAFREPYTEEQLGYAATVLQEIKIRMKVDIKNISEITRKEEVLEYYSDALELSLNELNKLEEDFSNWHECMGRTMDILVFCKKLYDL